MELVLPEKARRGVAQASASQSWDRQQELIRSLRAENGKLQENIQKALAARASGQPGTDLAQTAQEGQLQEEQLRNKDKRIAELRAEIQSIKDRSQQQANPMRAQVQDLEAQHAALRLELQQARAVGDDVDVGLLAADIRRAEETYGQLQGQLQRLASNPFISKTDDRREANFRVAQLEELIRQKTGEHERVADAHMKSEQARIASVQDRQRLEQRCREMKGRNERLQMELEGQAAEIRRVETEMRLLRERLPPENQEALERALQSLVTNEAAAFARIDVRGRDNVPSNQDLLSTDSMQRILERLAQERGQLEAQINALRSELERESATSRNLKALQMQELEDVRQKSRGYLLDRQKWERIAAAHLQTIRDLQRRIAELDAAVGALGSGEAEDGASSAGFSELSELEGFENSLDVCVGKGEVNSSALTSLEALLSAGGLSPDQLRTVVCMDMRGFDAGFSSVGVGHKPAYDSLVSFGPFITSQEWFEHMSNGSIGIELRGCLPAEREDQQHLLGKGSQALAGLLRYSADDRRNPVVAAVVPISDAKDEDVVVARVRLKLRLRYSVQELVEEYQHRVKVQQIDKEHLGRDVDPNLPGAPRTLCVQVRRVAGLPPAPRQLPEQLRPYVSFEVPGHAPHFTQTGAGPQAVFEDEACLAVDVDGKFCRWVETGGGLHFTVFDDAAAPPGAAADERALGLLGELRLSLRPLLHNALAAVEGAFTLRRSLADPGSPAMGSLDLRLFWKDFAAQRTAQALAAEAAAAAQQAAQQAAAAGQMATAAPAAAAPAAAAPQPAAQAARQPAMGDMEYQAVLGRLARRLASLGVKSVERAFDSLDVQGTGAIRRSDFLEGLVRMQVRGISDSEASRLFARLDADSDGQVVLQELRTALASCTQADSPFKAQEAWVRELFARIREAVERRPDLSARDVFSKLAQEVPAPSGSPGPGLDFARFGRLLRSFREDLQDGHLEHLWLMVDKDRNGLITFEEFSDIFGNAQALVQSAGTGAPPPGMSPEYFGILAGRLLRKLRAAGVATLEMAVRRFDQDGDGRLTRKELENALVLDAPNISQLERTQFVARMDADNDGVITTRELEVALQQGCGAHTQAEQRAEAVFARIRGAILRAGQRPEQVFTGLCRGQSVMDKATFQQLVGGFAPDLPAQSVELMWQLVDKDGDGSLAYDEFRHHFAQPPAAVAAPAAAPAQPVAAAQPAAAVAAVRPAMAQAAAVHQPVAAAATARPVAGQPAPLQAAVAHPPLPTAAARPAAVAPAQAQAVGGQMTAEHFGILVGRLLRKLRSVGIATVEMAVRHFDQDGDGRLTRRELEAALLRDAPNLSQQERAQFAARMDANNDGLISASELQLAFQQGGAAHGQAEQRGDEVFGRVRAAIERLGQPLEQVFAGLCRGQSLMGRPTFDQLVHSFDSSLLAQSVELMWQLCDKNNDGALTFEEFRLHFGRPAAQAAQAPQAPQAAVAPQAPQAPQAQAAPAVHQPQPACSPHTAGDRLVLGAIQRLIERHGMGALAFFQRMDVNKDGRLSADEFAAGLVGLGLGVDRAELRKFFLQIEGATMGRLPIPKLADAVSGAGAATPPAAGQAAPHPPVAARPVVAAQPVQGQTPLPAAAGQAAPQPPMAARPVVAAQPMQGQTPLPGQAGAGQPATAAAAAGTAAAAPGAAAPGQPAAQPQRPADLPQRVKEAVAQQGTGEADVEQLYQRFITNGRPALSKADFEQLVRKIDAALTPEAFARLWQQVAEDAGAHFVTFTQFCTHLCPVALDPSLSALPGGKQLSAYLHRLHRAVGRVGTVQQALSVFDATNTGVLPFEDFLHACSSSGFCLSRLELEKVFSQLARRPPGANQKQMEFRTLEFALQSAKAPAEADWTQKLVASIHERARAAGVLLEASFAQEQQEAVPSSRIKEEFGKYLTLDNQQWATVLVFLDKQSDGRVLWRKLLQWAGVLAG